MRFAFIILSFTGVNPDGHQSFDSLLERDKDSDVLTSLSNLINTTFSLIEIDINCYHYFIFLFTIEKNLYTLMGIAKL